MGRYNFSINIDKESLIHNYNYIKDSTQKDIISVVKGNAYGHGLKETVSSLKEAGCNYFAVARESEAEELLALNFDNINILVFETLDDFSLLKENSNLEMVINSLDEFKEILDLNLNFEQLHLKLDFGFGRNGITQEELIEVKSIIDENNINFKGVMTHLFSANEKEMVDVQASFINAINFIGRERFKVIHSQHSAAVFHGVTFGSTHLRCGCNLLGLLDSDFTDPNLKRVFNFSGNIADIKPLSSLNFIGYERIENLNLNNNNNIAKIKLGYGDGFSRKNTYLNCLINNKEFPIVHVSMDTSFVAVDDTVKAGDVVEVYHDLKTSDAHLDSTHYEYISIINNRIKRAFVEK